MKYLIQYLILIPIFFFVFSACVVKDSTLETIPIGENANDLVSVELFTRAYGYSTPISRSTADEFEVGKTPWVLVFRGSDDNAMFYEAAQAYLNAAEKIFVDLIPQNESCRLLIIANPDESFYLFEGGGMNSYPADAGTMNEKLMGKSLMEVCSILYTNPLDDPQVGRPFIGEPLPMSYLFTAEGGLNSGTVVDNNGSALGLIRATAKLYIKNLDSDFTLLEVVYAGDAARQGLIYNLDGTPPVDVPTVNYTAESGYLAYVNADQSTEEEPIYFYESPENETFMIIYGIYRQQPYYYKMALPEIIRNSVYSCAIQQITGTGFGTLEDAVLSRGSNLVDLQITVSDLDAYEIAANNHYYLSISNSVFIAYTPFGQPYHTFEAFTVATDCGIDFPNANQLNSRNLWGNPILDILDPVSIPLQTSHTVTVGFPDVLGSNEGRYPVYANLRLGNMEKNVFVRRHGGIPREGSVFTLENFYNVSGYHVLASGSVLDGADWIQLADGDQPENIGPNPNRIVLDTPGTIYIHVSPNLSGQQRIGYVMFTSTAPSFESGLVNTLQGTTYNIKTAIVQEY